MGLLQSLIVFLLVKEQTWQKFKIRFIEEENPNIAKGDSSGSVEGKSRFECHCGKSFSHKTNLYAHNL
jgi:transposase-like protein